MPNKLPSVWTWVRLPLVFGLTAPGTWSYIMGLGLSGALLYWLLSLLVWVTRFLDHLREKNLFGNTVLGDIEHYNMAAEMILQWQELEAWLVRILAGQNIESLG